MGYYGDHVVPRLVDIALGAPMKPVRERVASGLSGEVLEIGFGSGRNIPHLPSTVTRLLAVEPAQVGRRLAARRIAAASFPVEFIGDDGARLALGEASVDHALVTFSLCTIPDVERALSEVYRVLRPGGTLHFVEHGLSPDPRVARGQARMNPLWGRMCGGCHLDRPIDTLIEGAGFTFETITRQSMGVPRIASYLYRGVATKPA